MNNENISHTYKSLFPKLTICQFVYLVELIVNNDFDDKDTLLEEVSDAFYKKLTKKNWLHVLKNIRHRPGYSILKKKIDQYYLSEIMNKIETRIFDSGTPYGLLGKYSIKAKMLECNRKYS